MAGQLMQWDFEIENLIHNEVKIKRKIWLKKGELFLEKKGERLNVYLLGDDQNEWEPLRFGDEPDEKPSEIRFLIKFRKIVENPELTKIEQESKIDSLVTKNREVAKSFFHVTSSLKPSEQWFSNLLT